MCREKVSEMVRHHSRRREKVCEGVRHHCRCKQKVCEIVTHHCRCREKVSEGPDTTVGVERRMYLKWSDTL